MLMNDSLVLGHPTLARDRMEEVNGCACLCVCGGEVLYPHVETSRITQDSSLLYLMQSWLYCAGSFLKLGPIDTVKFSPLPPWSAATLADAKTSACPEQLIRLQRLPKISKSSYENEIL